MKHKSILAVTLVVVTIISVLVISCRKDNEENRHEKRPIETDFELSEMDKTMIDFGEKLKTSSKGSEAMPFANAINTLTNYQNFSLCDASFFSTDMQRDTFEVAVNVIDGNILLSELNRVYQSSKNVILAKKEELSGNQTTIYSVRMIPQVQRDINMDSYTGTINVSVVSKMSDAKGSPLNPSLFDTTEYWYDFEYLGKCGSYVGLCVGRDCVTELNSKFASNMPVYTCAPGYRVYFTHFADYYLTSTGLPDSNSPNQHYALPWRSEDDPAVCVSPSDMNYYLNVLEGIRTSYETTNYPTQITDYTLTESSYVKTGQENWKVNFYFEMAFVNCILDGGGAD